MACALTIPGPRSYEKGVPRTAQHGLAMNRNRFQQDGHNAPGSSTLSSQDRQAGGMARSSAKRPVNLAIRDSVAGKELIIRSGIGFIFRDRVSYRPEFRIDTARKPVTQSESSKSDSSPNPPSLIYFLRAGRALSCRPSSLYRLGSCASRGARLILGALSIQKGAVPDLARGPGHTAPTYKVGSQDCSPYHGRRGFACYPWTDFLDKPQALDKPAMRAMCLDRRNALSPEFREKASRQICHHVMDLLSDRALLKGSEIKGLEISAYLPIRSEVDLSDLIPQLEGAGALVSLPVVLSRTEIVFRRFRSGDVLQTAGFGTTGPAADAETVDPALLLMPLAGFDAKGARIGYGAGHYDRAIQRMLEKSLTPITIGIGFATQNVPHVPAEPHDMPLAAIVTENGIMNAMDVNA